jgi:hypothetical protein
VGIGRDLPQSAKDAYIRQIGLAWEAGNHNYALTLLEEYGAKCYKAGHQEGRDDLLNDIKRLAR